MIQFDLFKAMTLEEFAEWLDKNGQFDGSPWMTWFNSNFCNKCESIECAYSDYWKSDANFSYTGKLECSYCELEGKCKFFPEMPDTPSNKDIIIMWLKEPVKNDEKK